MADPASLSSALVERLNDALPQTQCTRCGYPECRSYADAIAAGDAEINQCPPGGHEGIVRLAALASRAVVPLNSANGSEGPRRLAVIDEAWCIGCTLCLDACPVDCIALVEVTGVRTGWNAWSAEQATAARERFTWHRLRLERDRREHDERLAALDRGDNPDR